MKIYWQLDIDSAINAQRVEYLIRKNNNNSYTILGIAYTQKQYDELNDKYFKRRG